MKIAIAGCVHGEIETVYNLIEYIEKKNKIHVDLILCCGDFQSSRNLEDVRCMAAPVKYQLLCSFYKYYSGQKTAPKLTIFIGGNHEASNYLQELPYGGWVAPNIYYLGYAGVVKVAGIRIAGLSGIFKDSDFLKGRYEKPPYNAESVRSCYHVRNLEIFRLKQLSSPLQIMMTHDWPEGISQYGNLHQLLRFKPHFREDIEKDKLGNPTTTELLKSLKPDYWFAAHLHAKFAALFIHNDDGSNKVTKFLALDKCLPKRKFLQILDIPHDPKSEIELEYDLEWLTVLHLTNHLISIKKLNNYMPGPNSGERWEFTPTEEEMAYVLNKFDNNLLIPKNFTPTATAHDPDKNFDSSVAMKVNPQTVEFCRKLCVNDPITLLQDEARFKKRSFGESLTRFENSSFISHSEADESVPSNYSQTSSRGPVRTPLKLPTPKISFDNIVTSTPVLAAKDCKNDENIDSPNDELHLAEAKTHLDNVTNETPRAFKRRNIAIYSNDSDDND